MPRKLALVALVAAVLAVPGHAQQNSVLANLKTTAEASDFKSTSTYDDVVKFMKTVDDASPIVFYTTYGTTYEGRPMPLAIVGTGIKDGSPASVKASGKLRVHIQANIHAGEVEGKESAQILLRQLAMGEHADWLRSMVLLVTPIFNADGNEKFATNNRGRQNGPINGQGTRANGQNININRDFMKLETPEGRAFVKLWNDYDPQVGFDLHTSDGSAEGYYLTYAPPLNPDTSDAIMKIMKDEWFPFVTKNIKTKYGWDTFYYGGPGRGGAPGAGAGGRGRGNAAGGATGGAGGDRGAGAGGAVTGAVPTPEVVGATPQAGQMRSWNTFEHVPRYHNNYVGMRNRFALLSEAYAYSTFEDRIKATNYFVEESLNFANANADRLKKAVEAADKESIIGTQEATRAQFKRGGVMTVLTGELEDEKNPVSGAMMSRRKDVVHEEQMIDMLWFEPSKTEDVPHEYYVPASATKAVELLQAHGIKMRQLTAPVRGVEQFAITSNTQRAANPNSIDTGVHGLRSLDGSWQAAPADVTAPAGAWVVDMNQPLARLAFYLLAPTSDDGLTAWNYLDDSLGADAKTYPILRKK
jgi:murein tripeptide amidase MpaA